MLNVTTYRKSYKPSTYVATTMSLQFDLYDDYALVMNKMTLQRQYPGDLRLNGEELALVSLHLNGSQLSDKAYCFEGRDLIIKDCPDSLSLSIVTRIEPQNNTVLSGLYRSHELFCTQCEAEGFRRMTYALDRPDVLSTFTTKITADKLHYPVLLSNGNLQDSGETADGRHWVVWHDPFKKPTYLFALVVGKLVCVTDQFITCSDRVIDLHIYVEPGNEDKCAHAMASLKRAMRWDEEEYGREYDLDIFMIVAVSDFNMGAMENKGLNIFNAKYILARPDTATDQDYAAIEGVVGHEYFHNWTGNRVTCRDWFQLSLKEGLTVFRDQEFSCDMGSRAVNRIHDVQVLRNMQFPEDAGSMAHPVRPDAYQEINNFYTTTIYNKGAEVIRMQHTLLGKAGFRKGMDLYFKRHDGQAVTIDDFVAAMEDANHVDFTQFKHWYSQAGTPEVTVDSDYQAGCLTLSFSQYCPPTIECKDKQPFHIPIKIALFNAQGEMLPIENEVLELREVQQSFCFKGLSEKPSVSLLRDFSAPVILRRKINEEELLSLLRFETNGYAKWDAAQTLAIRCIQDCYYSSEETWSLPSSLVGAFRHVLLDDALEMALRAQLLIPPGFEDVAATLSDIDVEQVELARNFYRKALGTALFIDLQTAYRDLWKKERHDRSAEAYGRRKLRNVCLSLMMRANDAASLSDCEVQFSQAKTMTDQVASLDLLLNSSFIQVKQQSIKAFYQQWSSDALVLDKWFALQASAEQPDVLVNVKKLLSHSAFNLKNPNKVRAVVGAFIQNNPRYFHAADGSGYNFLTEILITLDKINPQVAARLATPFTRWQRLDKQRQMLIQAQLKRLSALKLSRDLRELVLKSFVKS